MLQSYLVKILPRIGSDFVPTLSVGIRISRFYGIILEF